MTTRYSDALDAFLRLSCYAMLLFGAILTAYWVGRTDERQTFAPICEAEPLTKSTQHRGDRR